MHAEEESQVAVDALLLEHLGRADALPRRGDLDEDALPLGARRPRTADERVGLLDGRLRVEGEPRVDLGGDAPGHDLEDAQPELHPEPVDGALDHVFLSAPAPASFFA